MTCCSSGRQTCFNFEDADYIAVDGFELIGGKYGVRAVGGGYAASAALARHRGARLQGPRPGPDPFFSGAVRLGRVGAQRRLRREEGRRPRHLSLSNGSDWNIVRFNETYGNVVERFPDQRRSGLHLRRTRASPSTTRAATPMPARAKAARARATTSSSTPTTSTTASANGPNFTSVRRSVVRNNIFGPQARHNVSFWQETDNPKLGSSDNKILHNLFVTTGRHGVKFENNSTRNEFANNVILGVQVDGDGKVTANPSALLMEVDGTVGDNVYRSNLYVSGKIEGRAPNGEETALADFPPSWFANFPAALNHDPNDFTPTAEAPFLGKGTLSPDAPTDRNGVARAGQGRPRADRGALNAPAWIVRRPPSSTIN